MTNISFLKQINIKPLELTILFLFYLMIHVICNRDQRNVKIDEKKHRKMWKEWKKEKGVYKGRLKRLC